MTSWALAEPQAPAGPWVPDGLWVPPRAATPRDLGRKTVGPGVAKVARALRLPPMPWQTYVSTVGGEVWPEGTVVEGEDLSGRYVFPLVLVTVQRQAGKSAIMLCQAVHRCLAKPDQRVWFTAQTGKDATAQYVAFMDRLLKSPLAEYIKGRPMFGAGNPGVTFVNGSELRPFSPGRDALHGKQSDYVSIDEGWSFDEASGAELFQAIAPTKATRPGAQTWIWSTRGDASSTWFHDQVDRAVENIGGTDSAVFDWGVPDGVVVDLDTIIEHHPAVGHTQTRSTIRAGIAEIGWDKRAEWTRAFGNRATGGKVRVIPEEAWDAARTFEDLDGRPAYGIGVWEPRDGGNVTGALVAASWGPDGVPVVEVLEERPGRAWLTERVKALRDRAAVAVDRRGPAGNIADQLELAGVELLPLSGTDKAAACQDLWDRLCDTEALEHGPRLRHRAEHEADEEGKVPPSRLDSAVDVAGRRFIGEGAWVWSARESTGNVAALEAATLAVRALEHAPAPVPVGRTVFG